MTREQVKKIFPEITEEQLKSVLDLNSADIGRAKGDQEKLQGDLAKANETIREYASTIAELKQAAEGSEDFKKKFEELERKVAEEKAEAERREQEAAEEAALSERFRAAVGENKWRDELTEKAVYSEFKNAVRDEANKGRGDRDILDGLTKDKEYYAQEPGRIPVFVRGTGGTGGGEANPFRFGFTGIRAREAEKK